jgi:hypothetical protein
MIKDYGMRVANVLRPRYDESGRLAARRRRKMERDEVGSLGW